MHPMPPLSPRRWIAHTLVGWILGVPLLLGLSILFEAVGIEHANAPVGLGMGAATGLLLGIATAAVLSRLHPKSA